MKRNEELSVLKEEIETVNKKFSELTENERKQVTGGEGLYRVGVRNAVDC